MIHEMHEMLAQVRARIRSVRLSRTLSICWLVWAAAACGAWALIRYNHWSWPSAWMVIVGAALVTAAVCWKLQLAATDDPHWIAHRVEAKHPELGSLLLTALELAPSPRFKRLGYLQSAAIRRAVDHGRRYNWAGDVPLAKVRLAQLAHLLALGLFVGSCVLLVSRNDAAARISTTTAADTPSRVETLSREVEVEPGDVEIERGTTLLVVARFNHDVPAEVSLIAENIFGPAPVPSDAADSESNVQIRSMTRSLDDPQFVGRIPSVTSDLSYHVEFSGEHSPKYRVKVFEYPALVRTDAQLNYPVYTSLEPKRIEDIRHVSAVEGTQLTLECRLNKEVEIARLVDRDGEELNLNRSEGDTAVYTIAMELERSRRFKLHLVDREGRANKLPPEIVVNVTPNRPPVIKIARPARDVRVSPLEELRVAADLSDDFGILRYGISYALGGDNEQEVVLFGDDAAREQLLPRKKDGVSYLVDFESLAAKPDELVSYYVWAEDAGLDAQRRQTMSDMYFAEVRHFEEIFRQGEQPTEQQMREQQSGQQGQQNGQRAEQLAELQKQIVSATWTLVRRQAPERPGNEFADDVRLVAESQQQAIDQLAELGAELTDQESLHLVDQAEQEMQTALVRLTDSADVDGLRPALSAEQAAYQALLKLRAREFNIVQGGAPQSGPSSGSASGAGSRSQQQLQQLELSADENRYETQSRALRGQEQENARQQAQEILDRLRELARRQEDLNERVREIRSELEAARTNEERDEIERELKRLREQQQEILRDTDELRSDMENSSNQQQLQEAQQQLDETRSRVQQASEALEEGRLSQAITEGTRAGRELKELRDEFRRQTADRFSDEMRELRDAAQQLDERQQQLSENIAAQNDDQNRSLRDSGAREEILQGLEEQQRQFREIMEQMQQTVQEAEQPEPLLARQLYDTVREATDRQIEDALRVTQQLLDAGITREAGETMRAADQGIDQLREGVDRAAQSVLGDETEALRRAEQELRDLAEQLNREIENAQNPQSGERESNDGQRSGETPSQTGRSPSGEPGPEPTEAGDSNPANQDAQNSQSPSSNQSGRPAEAQSNSTGGGQNEDGQPRENEQDQRRPGNFSSNSQPERAGNRNGGGGGPDQPGDLEELFAGIADPGGPITGEDFRQWSDRMRNVQELLEDPELSSEVARIRDRAEEARREFRRHSQEPDWTKLTDMVAEPLDELRKRIADEIRRKESPDALVPIDRDPVPVEYVENVRLYYERLGSGE